MPHNKGYRRLNFGIGTAKFPSIFYAKDINPGTESSATNSETENLSHHTTTAKQDIILCRRGRGRSRSPRRSRRTVF